MNTKAATTTKASFTTKFQQLEPSRPYKSPPELKIVFGSGHHKTLYALFIIIVQLIAHALLYRAVHMILIVPMQRDIYCRQFKMSHLIK